MPMTYKNSTPNKNCLINKWGTAAERRPWMLRLSSNAASGYAMRYPALGPKKTPNPPLPPERRGAPHATISKKSNWLKNAAFGFRMLPDKSTPIVWSVIGTGVKDKKSGGSSPKSPIMAVNTAICIISVNFIMYSSSLSKYVYTIKRVFIYVNSIIF